MGRRRKAREVALQFLYQLDQHDETDPTVQEADFWARHPVDDETRAFAADLVRGTKRRQAAVDELIAQYAEHWELERMAVVDRNILRLAAFELVAEFDRRVEAKAKAYFERWKADHEANARRAADGGAQGDRVGDGAADGGNGP